METDITKTAPVAVMIEIVKGQIAEIEEKFHSRITERRIDLHYVMEGADDMFKMGAEHKVKRYIVMWLEWNVKENVERVTYKQIQEAVWEEFKHTAPVARSTSMSHNAAEQFLLSVVLDITNKSGFGMHFFSQAQFKCPLIRAQWEADAERKRIAKAAEDAATAAAKRQAKSDARKARRAAQA